jgi:hypothetical protein
MKIMFRNSAKWMIELDRWVYRLTGADQETIVRKSIESFLTDKTPINDWVNYVDYEEVRLL